MLTPNLSYANLKESYLFYHIAQKTKAYLAEHPGTHLYRMGIGDVSLPLVPAVIAALHEGVDDQAHKDRFHGYMPECGAPSLRETIAQHYKKRDVYLSPEEVFVSSGASDELGDLLDLFDRSNKALIMEPAYPAYVDANIMAGREIIHLPSGPEDHFLPLPRHDLDADLVYLCSPNNPTGAAYDREQLTRDLTEMLTCGRDRLVTVPTPALQKADVVFSTDPALQLYEYFMDRTNTSMVFRGMSDWKVGDAVAPENMTVKAVRTLPNSSRNAAYDPEGAPIRDLALVENGKVVSYWGGRQFSQYLGMDSSFSASNFTVSGGTESAETLRSGDFLEVVEFSDFNVDSITGDIAGEIRLGYLHQGGKVIPVSGGSVSGSVPELISGFRFSAESRQYNNFLIPAVTRIQGVTVTGAEG